MENENRCRAEICPCDTSVQVQGLPGRMSGYWKQEILGGHKTGPYRTSIEAILEYEEFYKNPLKIGKYTTAHRNKPFVSPKFIKNLEIIDLVDGDDEDAGEIEYRVYDSETVVKKVCRHLDISIGNQKKFRRV
jgi:hypothetical protein